MRLIVEEPNYIFEDFHKIKSIEDIADVLLCFLEKDDSFIFGCVDLKYFLENLDTEKDSTQEFYKNIIESNKKNGMSIFKEDNEETEKFIEQRTVFTNNGEDFPLNIFERKRRTIWYKTLGKSEIIKAIRINREFKCIVLKENSPFNDFRYALEHCESDDGTALIVMEKEKDSFLNKVYPKITKAIDSIKFE